VPKKPAARKPVPSLTEMISLEAGRHFFVTPHQCRCGFEPVNAAEWQAHLRATIVTGVCDWLEAVAKRAVGLRGLYAHVSITSVARIIRARLAKETEDRGQRR
jgi:hypothetical protein